MAKPVTKSQLVAELAEKASLTKKAADNILDFIVQIAFQGSKKQLHTLPGLGKNCTRSAQGSSEQNSCNR